MKQRNKAGGKAAEPTDKTSKHRNAPKSGRPAATVKQTNIVRVARERDEALEQLAATSDVLKVISQPAFDLHAVFDKLMEAVTRLCQASTSVLWRPASDGTYHLATGHGLSPEFKRHLQSLSLKPGGHSVVGRCLQAGRSVYVPDLMADPEYTKRRVNEFGGYHGLLCVPLMREGAPIGVLMVGHKSARKFSTQEMGLVATRPSPFSQRSQSSAL